MSRRILITGASGVLGGALARALRQRGYEAAGFSRSKACHSLTGDLRNSADIRAALAAFEPEIVFNLAAETDLKARCHDFSVNTVGVLNLVEAVARTASVRRAIWGSSTLVCCPGHRPMHDEDYCPSTLYGESKVEGEQIVRQSDGGGRCWIIVRPSTVWGPGMGPHYVKLLRLIRKGLYFHVGWKPVYKSYSFIENTVHQLVALAEAEESRVNRRTFYLADSEPIEIRAWCDQFASHFGTTIPTLPLPAARMLAMAGDLFHIGGLRRFPFTTAQLDNILTEYILDVRPIEKIAGRSLVSNEEGVRQTAAWFENIRAYEGDAVHQR